MSSGVKVSSNAALPFSSDFSLSSAPISDETSVNSKFSGPIDCVPIFEIFLSTKIFTDKSSGNSSGTKVLLKTTVTL